MQIQALLGLLADVCQRQQIPGRQIIAHADMAPTRKVDPGSQFPWRQLATAGFGIWPAATAGEPPPDFDSLAALALLGYLMADPAAAIAAFHRRFCGQDGLPAGARRQGCANSPWLADPSLSRHRRGVAAMNPAAVQSRPRP